MDRVHASDVPLDLWSHVRVWLACGGLLGILAGLAADPAWVEERYVRGWGAEIASTLAWITSHAPFSVAEVGIATLVLFEVWRLLDAASEVGAGRRRWANALFGGLAHVIDAIAVGLLWFYLAWGLSYARPPALAREGWAPPLDPASPPAAELLTWQARQAVASANRAYLQLHGVPDAGVVTEPADPAGLARALDDGFTASGRALGLPSSYGASRGAAKVPYLSEAMSWAGIGGIYIPFSGEAHVNGGPPAWSRVMTTAHEMAHQRMVASEDEASFYGFLACAHSNDPLLRYAAWEFAARQLLRPLAAADKATAEAVKGELLPGIRRDQQAVGAYWAGYAGWMDDLAERMNDTYLKANHVEGGVQAYGRAGKLIAAWLATEDGGLTLIRGTGATGANGVNAR